ncbi:nicotinamide-nucleotide adenylyltransferase [Thermoproteus tenax]|uniref:Nicotinamide-nucleotide adenylyltransferase n=1 Tax=Thermoproteus tenax (strain ATCC 35583 / DSM 2078 / JCM 9277 / NBRC 100435 / Kra 1) TaxID=768679 RepID=G4RN85_THETK|nr:nicotinamide-nucleotide adenylyltransferase [Thermoproteus tenax]CCC81029.1 nicotinamide-nucleotide adenylyltransferase [Thermoproteus tenax Kra 1]
MRAFFPGRFQPPHWGHVRAISAILQEADEVVVGVGSAQFNYLLKDPFTAGERIWMLREGLRDGGVDLARVVVVPIPNVENNLEWLGRVKSYAPPFDVVYTGNPFVALLFREAGVPVKQQPLFDRGRLSSTKVRELLLRGDPGWEELVPPSVARIIKQLGGAERLRIAAQGEAEPHRW